MVTTRAVVARRVMPGTQEGPTGLGLYFLDGLSTLASERRNTGRANTNLAARLYIDRHEIGARIADISDWGASIDVDLGLKTLGASSSAVRRVAPFAHLLRPGHRIRLKFPHPYNGQRVLVGAVIARTPQPLPGERVEYRMGIRFDMSMSTIVDRAAAAPRPHVATERVRITGAAEVDHLATRELHMRSLLRAIDWSAQDGTDGEARLVLAGPRRLLVATRYDPPAEGQSCTLTMQTPEESSCPPLAIECRVARSSTTLVTGREPGFVAEIVSFYSPGDEQRYSGLVSWLVKGLDG